MVGIGQEAARFGAITRVCIDAFEVSSRKKEIVLNALFVVVMLR